MPNDESDLDIIVITPDEFLPVTNRERMCIHHKYNPLIKKFRKHIPIDLMVYTKMMFLKLMETGSSFSEEIRLRGKVLYETIN